MFTCLKNISTSFLHSSLPRPNQANVTYLNSNETLSFKQQLLKISKSIFLGKISTRRDRFSRNGEEEHIPFFLENKVRRGCVAMYQWS